jgi:hypothetical protein
MRTAPLALAYLDDADALAEAALKVSALTHYDPEAGEACVLWCLAIRHAVLHGTFDGLRAALEVLPPDRGMVWSQRLDEAEAKPPRAFDKNGWVVQAIQGAWSAISRTPVPADDPATESFPSHHLRLSLEAAVRGGKDTDTVAAIAGGLLGGRWGSTAVPASWRRIIHGWPEYRSRDLVRLAMQAVDPKTRSGSAWPIGTHVDYSGYGDTEPWYGIRSMTGCGSVASPESPSRRRVWTRSSRSAGSAPRSC